MKDVENVTGSMGESEAVTPSEEVTNIVVADDAESAEHQKTDTDTDADADEMKIARTESPALPPRDTSPDSWQALVQIGAQFIGALVAAHDLQASVHPWIERDPVTGVQSLRMPLPPPETTRQLANALTALADTLRGKPG